MISPGGYVVSNRTRTVAKELKEKPQIFKDWFAKVNCLTPIDSRGAIHSNKNSENFETKVA